jgi:hypothetical protein
MIDAGAGIEVLVALELLSLSLEEKDERVLTLVLFASSIVAGIVGVDSDDKNWFVDEEEIEALVGMELDPLKKTLYCVAKSEAAELGFEHVNFAVNLLGPSLTVEL